MTYSSEQLLRWPSCLRGYHSTLIATHVRIPVEQMEQSCKKVTSDMRLGSGCYRVLHQPQWGFNMAEKMTRNESQNPKVGGFTSWNSHTEIANILHLQERLMVCCERVDVSLDE